MPVWILALVLVGCGGGVTPERGAEDPGRSVDADARDGATPGAGCLVVEGAREPGGRARRLTARDGRLIVTDHQGKQLWKHTLGGACHAAPVAAGGLLVVGCDDGRVYAFREK